MSKHSFAVPADILGTWKVHTTSKVRSASGPLRQVSTVQTAGLPATAQSFCQHRKNVKKNNLCLRPSKKILKYLHIYDGIAAITEGRTHLELCPGRAENRLRPGTLAPNLVENQFQIVLLKRNRTLSIQTAKSYCFTIIELKTVPRALWNTMLLFAHFKDFYGGVYATK